LGARCRLRRCSGVATCRNTDDVDVVVVMGGAGLGTRSARFPPRFGFGETEASFGDFGVTFSGGRREAVPRIGCIQVGGTGGPAGARGAIGASADEQQGNEGDFVGHV
jgi:hypothetical protein